MNTKKGRFIIFEGIDGSGKSTQIQLLKQRIEQFENNQCYETAEPSGGPIGSMLRQFLSGRMKTDEKTLATLFASDRLDHLSNETDGIISKIENGIHVICDRYVLSNYAYQGVNVSLDWIMQLNSMALNMLHPDCHIFIDVDPDMALQRISNGRFHKEIYESKERLTKVRNCYYNLFELLQEKENIIIINGNQSIEKVSEEIWNNVSKLFLS